MEPRARGRADLSPCSGRRLGRAPRPGDPLLGRRHARGCARPHAHPLRRPLRREHRAALGRWSRRQRSAPHGRHDDGRRRPQNRRLHVQLPQLHPRSTHVRCSTSARWSSRSSSTTCTAPGSAGTSSPRERVRYATPSAAICTPSRIVDNPSEDARYRRGGGALAVDLRRARAAQRRIERAEARAAGIAVPRPSRSRGFRVACGDREPLACVREWFTLHGWTPFAFQEEVWRAYLAGESALVHAATGTGKTYAAWLGPVLEWLRDYPAVGRRKAAAPPLRVLWITPLRALAGDTESALRAPIEDLGLPWTVETRTGDTPARIRARQRDRLPTALVTTPESLTLLLTREDAHDLFDHLELVVVDEWHELLASKRGVQTELALARLRRFKPSVRTLGLSATLGNLDVARDALLGLEADGTPRPGRLVRGLLPKALEVDALIPSTMERFPWSGQMGLRMLPEVVRRHRGGRERAGVHQHARDRRDLVSGAAGRAPRLGGDHGAPPRLDRSRHPRMGGGRPPRREAAMRGVHLHAGPGRGLHARGPGAPDRKPEGRRPPDPTRGAKRSPARRGEPADLRPHQRAGARGRRCRTGGAARGAHRGTPPGRAPARPARAARRHRRPGRRLHRRTSSSTRCARPTPFAT